MDRDDRIPPSLRLPEPLDDGFADGQVHLVDEMHALGELDHLVRALLAVEAHQHLVVMRLARAQVDHGLEAEAHLPLRDRRLEVPDLAERDRKSTRLNSSHYCATRMP